MDSSIKNLKGLSHIEAQKRLKESGYNELPTAKSANFLGLAKEIIFEPMFALLIICALLYLLLGDKEESLILSCSVIFIAAITVYQRNKTEKALKALKDLSSPRALVIRNSEKKRIPGREVVRGDIILIAEGDRIPADAILVHSRNLTVDESLLTGESVPVRKSSGSGKQEMSRPGGDNSPFLFSGSLAVGGQGIAEVKATGRNTELGRIGKALEDVEVRETDLQRQIGRIVKLFALLGLIVCVLVVIIYSLATHDWLKGLLAGLALAMSLLPEELPVILTVFFALGAWRMSRHQVLARKVPVVEMLGAATVLCTDKTGTLTKNSMSIVKVCVGSRIYDIKGNELSVDEKLHEIMEYSLLSTPRNPFDPMEKAIKAFSKKILKHTQHIHEDWKFVKEYPLSSKLMAMSHVWRSGARDEYVVAAKGSPEAVMDLCHLEDGMKGAVTKDIEELAKQSLRVIAVAKAVFSADLLPDSQHGFKMQFLGLLGLKDPIRPEVPAALKECISAGIKPMMITGDYSSTAGQIGREIGLAEPVNIMTGQELEKLSDMALAGKIGSVSIFARTLPEQKLRIVNALKANGEIVAMTGDGVNDAPALKAAHIGIAMGGRGSDVAREASSLVLLDDNFASIVRAVKMGRRINDNIKKAMLYVLIMHIAIAGISILPVALGWPLVLLPVHLVFLELIIDPACSIVFEMERPEKDIMNRPPRNIKEPIFGRASLIMGIGQGLIMLAAIAALYFFARNLGYGEDETRTIVYANLILGNLAMISINRTQTRGMIDTFKNPNPALWWMTGIALAVLGLIITVPRFRQPFHFGALGFFEIGLCLASFAAMIVFAEIFKKYRLKKTG